jgi:hypothetical protein
MPATPTLPELLAELAEARREAVAIHRDLANQRSAFAMQYADLIEDDQAAAERVNALDQAVRQLAIAEAEATSNLRPAPGVEVCRTTNVVIADSAAALDWAFQHGICLALDTKALIKGVRAGVFAPHGVISRHDSLTRIATDLNEHYPAAAPALRAAS